MKDSRMEHGHPWGWSGRSTAAKISLVFVIAGAVVGMLALCSAVVMWLWNWLMPGIFKLPGIGFWQALGLLALSHILFKGGHAVHAGHSHWKRHQVWKHLREDGNEEDGAPFQARGAESAR